MKPRTINELMVTLVKRYNINSDQPRPATPLITPQKNRE
jgi:hypothetical protein